MSPSKLSTIFWSSTVAIGLAGAAVAQNAATPAQPRAQQGSWKAPGTPGSPIDGTILHAQVLLDAAGFSPGVIDGKPGISFDDAIRGFQEARGLRVNGKLDQPTRAALLSANKPSTRMLRVSPDDMAGPYTNPFPKEAEAQEKLDRLGYKAPIEKMAEKFHTTPQALAALNAPDAVLRAGAVLRFPNVLPSSRNYQGMKPEHAKLMSDLNVDGRQQRGDRVVVDKSDRVLRVFKGEQLIGQFPVTMGSRRDPLPLGTWKVTTFAYLPPFAFQPDLLWYVSKDEKERNIPPGPNGPVGVAWLDLTKEHYGIHGTPEPQTIGRAESAGCVRLTNWDVARLSRMIPTGTTAVFQA